MRIYEFSKKYNIPNKELIHQLHEGGFDIQSHMTLLSAEALAFLEKKYDTKKSPEKEVKTVTKELSQAPTVEQPLIAKEASLVLEPMSVGDFSKKTNQPISEVILALLRQGVIATKNQLLSKNIIANLAQAFDIPTIEQQQARNLKERVALTPLHGKKLEERLPVVVVVGHVDHGKTTLLDFIRKTRLAAKEKGGITQHLGAYEAKTAHGNIVFLDTPGHETFSLMRARGMNAADLAVLVVAADDGVMPQTVEAIKLIQKNELPVIVAINKIDKASPQQIEAVKTRLASYGLTPEEWGGQTIMIPISAKTGQGVDNLLEVIVLQSKMMELTASLSEPARGFILEAKLEQGRGPVATILCQQGTLHVGDFFICGGLSGRVNSLIDSSGKRVDAIRPSQPARVAGFSVLPHVGEFFEVVAAGEIKNRLNKESDKMFFARHSAEDNGFNIIIKADSASSQEALLGALEKLGSKNSRKIVIVHAAIGAIKESDVNLAAATHALIYGLHVKVEPNALVLAQRLGIVIKLFDIIYKLLEHMSSAIDQAKPVKMVSKKIGEAVILKIFDIKNIGIIAGAQVKTGRLVKDAKVIIWRGKHKIGEGLILSLQRDKKTVKEVHAGFECAFVVDKFSEWLVDDRVECYIETPEI